MLLSASVSASASTGAVSASTSSTGSSGASATGAASTLATGGARPRLAFSSARPHAGSAVRQLDDQGGLSGHVGGRRFRVQRAVQQPRGSLGWVVVLIALSPSFLGHSKRVSGPVAMAVAHLVSTPVAIRVALAVAPLVGFGRIGGKRSYARALGTWHRPLVHPHRRDRQPPLPEPQVRRLRMDALGTRPLRQIRTTNTPLEHPYAHYRSVLR